MKKLLFAVLAVCVCSGAAFAGSPIKLSIFGDIAVPNTQKVDGLGIGLLSMTDHVCGLQFDFIYSDVKEMTGLQTAIVGKTTNFTGVQWSFVNLTENGNGASLGAVNWAQSHKILQLGWVNYAANDMKGLQWGLVNYTKEMNGLQLGFVNYTENMNGVQIGLVNVIRNSKLPVMIIANAKF